NGRVKAFVDTASASGLPALRVIGDASGVWAKTTADSCFVSQKETAAPVALGKRLFATGSGSFFEPLHRSGSIVVVRENHGEVVLFHSFAQFYDVYRVSSTAKAVVSSTTNLRQSNRSNYTSRSSYRTLSAPGSAAQAAAALLSPAGGIPGARRE